MVAVGSDDSVVRIWGGIYRSEVPNLVTTWRALSIEGEQPSNSGLVLEWQQRNELVIASGNIDALKVWDINRELILQDIPTNSNSSVTCITSDKSDGERLIVAGCWDGSIRLFDRRLSSKYSQVAAFNEHKRLVVSACMPQSLYKQIISGSSSGEIKFWDVRNTKSSVRQFVPDRKGENQMTALAVHEYAPILALGQDQKIKAMNFSGENLNVIRYHDGFLGQRIGPVSALAFHPYRVMLGAGATDSIVSIYAGEPFNKPKE